MSDEQLALEFLAPAERHDVARVLRIIRQHRGRPQAISMKSIEERTGIPGRTVQAIVKFLVEERDVAIGTATSAPYGYYLIRELGELVAVRNQFIRRGLSNLRHAKAYERGALLGPIIGQLEIALEANDEVPS